MMLLEALNSHLIMVHKNHSHFRNETILVLFLQAGSLYGGKQQICTKKSHVLNILRGPSV